jgi:hypothetical protein
VRDAVFARFVTQPKLIALAVVGYPNNLLYTRGMAVTCWAAVKHKQPDGSVIEKRCKMSPMKGLNVCRFHGALAPQVRAAAEVRESTEKAKVALARFGVPIAGDPKEILLRQLHVAYGNSMVLERLIAEVEPEQVGSDDPQERARARGLLNLHAEWQTRAAALAVAAVRAGLEERMVQAAEWQVKTLFDAFQLGLEKAQLNPEDKSRVLQAVATEVRLIAVSG